MPIKVDLHVHSCYSSDSVITPAKLQMYAKERELDAVAITDHDRLDGANKIAEEVDVPVIPGIEVSSLRGHINGLFVNTSIPRGLSAEETVERIHYAGGIAVACHPGSLLKGSIDASTNIRFDCVEVINASAFPFGRSVRIGEELSSRLQAARVGGSDAHYGPDIGCACTIIDSDVDFDHIAHAIKEHSCHPVGNAISMGLRIRRRASALLK